jgi:hypothetical protein
MRKPNNNIQFNLNDDQKNIAAALSEGRPDLADVRPLLSAHPLPPLYHAAAHCSRKCREGTDTSIAMICALLSFSEVRWLLADRSLLSCCPDFRRLTQRCLLAAAFLCHRGRLK